MQPGFPDWTVHFSYNCKNNHPDTQSLHPFTIEAADRDAEIISKVILFNQHHEEQLCLYPDTSLVHVEDSLETFDGDYFYVKITQQDGDEAISSPVWISAEVKSTPDE